MSFCDITNKQKFLNEVDHLFLWVVVLRRCTHKSDNRCDQRSSLVEHITNANVQLSPLGNLLTQGLKAGVGLSEVVCW